MSTTTKKLTSLAAIALLSVNLAAPSLAHADRGHHHRHHHGHHHHKHHSHFNGYVYSQPRGYYQPYYPQPQYSYNYSYYPPAPVYAVPPQMMMGINTGNVDFMLRF
ncbi:MAG: hypothetical protein HRU78_10355 [Gammaproteobacteria bacterium]|nr:MAG: hypothetical protein HRU78_10355 [Gammaproteobacteria bacterium]